MSRQKRWNSAGFKKVAGFESAALHQLDHTCSLDSVSLGCAYTPTSLALVFSVQISKLSLVGLKQHLKGAGLEFVQISH